MSSEISQYPFAIARGVVLGLKDSLDTLLHPIHTFKLLSLFIYDATSIAYAHVHRAHLMNDHANKRMQERMDDFWQVGVETINSPGPMRAQIITRILTSTLSMNGILKVMVNTRPTLLRNLRDFGNLEEPPKFKNLKHDCPPVHPPFDPLTSKKLRKIKGEAEFIYVFREDRKLVIAGCDLEIPVIRSGELSSLLHHHDLAQGQLVYAAGHAFTYHGEVKWITEASGHFAPHGKNLGKIVEHAFIRNGYGNVTGKYKPFYNDNIDYGNMVITETKIYSLSTEQKCITAIYAMTKTEKESKPNAPIRLLTPLFHKKSSTSKSRFFSMQLASPRFYENTACVLPMPIFHSASSNVIPSGPRK